MIIEGKADQAPHQVLVLAPPAGIFQAKAVVVQEASAE